MGDLGSVRAPAHEALADNSALQLPHHPPMGSAPQHAGGSRGEAARLQEQDGVQRGEQDEGVEAMKDSQHQEGGRGAGQPSLLAAEEQWQAALESELAGEYDATLQLAPVAYTLWREGKEVEAEAEEQDKQSSWTEHLDQLAGWLLRRAPAAQEGAEAVEVALVVGREGGGLSTLCAALPWQAFAAAASSSLSPPSLPSPR